MIGNLFTGDAEIISTDGDSFPCIDTDHLNAVIETLRSVGEKRKGLDVAIRRWIRSKRGMSTFDQLIDLRIALEALYLKDSGSGEMSYRMATRGAWHLSGDRDERVEYSKTLKEAYSLASRVIHASEKPTDEKDLTVLKAGQDACRRGILKMLTEGEPDNWDHIEFGCK